MLFQYLKNIQITTKCLLLLNLKLSTRPIYKIEDTHIKSQNFTTILKSKTQTNSFYPSMRYISPRLNYDASSHYLYLRIKKHVLTCLW
jgi:hypothetical protein